MEDYVFTMLLILYSDDEPWMILEKCISVSSPSSAYTAVTVALLAAGLPIGAPCIRSWYS